MDFGLTTDQELIREEARRFAEAVLLPRAAHLDETGEFPREAIRRAGELGFCGMLVDEAYGGTALGHVAMVLIMEELNRCCAATGVSISVTASLVCSLLNHFGTEEQKRRWLPDLANGQRLGAYCLSEPGSGSDAASLTTRFREEDGEFILDGTKAWITNGGQADDYLVYATEDPTRGHKGISCILVEADRQGLSFGAPEKKLGIRGSRTTQMTLEGVRVPKGNLIGERGRGFHVALWTLDGGRMGIAAQALGIHRACLEASTKYARERSQFGQALASFQALRFKLAEMATQLDAARLLTLRAAWLKDQGRPHTTEAAMAKRLASDVCNQAARDAIQIHGGVGYTRDFPVERYFRDAKITEIYEGTTEIQNIVISRGILGG